MLKSSFIWLSYAIESSKNYHRIKRKTYQILEDNSYPYKKYFDVFMIILVITTVAGLLYEVNHTPPKSLLIIEDIAMGVFILEWFGRLWVNGTVHTKVIKADAHSKLIGTPFPLKSVLWSITKEKFDFIFSPLSIIDLLSILPYYRPLRILRIFMFFRLFKLLRYTNSISQLVTIFVERKFDFLTLLILFAFIVFTGASALYVYEGHSGINEKMNNFFDALYWAVITVATVGYGDISPMSIEGKVITIFLVMGGFIVLAFGNAIITAAMLHKLKSIKETHSLTTIYKLKRFHVVCGFSKSARVLCKELKKQKEPFVVIDKLPKESLNLQDYELDYIFIQEDASSQRLIERIFFNNKIKSLIAMSNNDAVNISILLNAKSIKEGVHLMSIVNHSKNENKLRLAGAKETIKINNLSAFVGAGYIKHPIAFEAVERILIEDKKLTIDEINCKNIYDIDNIKLKDINFKRFKIMFLGISKINLEFVFNPSKETALENSDILIVIGHETSIKEFTLYLSKLKEKRK